MRIVKYNLERNSHFEHVLVRETTQNYTETDVLNSPEVITEMMNEVFRAKYQAEEHVWLLCLTTKGKLAGIFELSHGVIDGSYIGTREIFARILMLNSARIVLVHNHPSGDTTPSREDKTATCKLKDACDLLGIVLVDHIIVGDNFYSFNANNNL